MPLLLRWAFVKRWNLTFTPWIQVRSVTDWSTLKAISRRWRRLWSLRVKSIKNGKQEKSERRSYGGVRKSSTLLESFHAPPAHPSDRNCFILFLSEGRAGRAWELTNKVLLFLPPNKNVFYFSLAFHFLFSLLLGFISVSNVAISRSRQIKNEDVDMVTVVRSLK
jgi:hypothetical protein